MWIRKIAMSLLVGGVMISTFGRLAAREGDGAAATAEVSGELIQEEGGDRDTVRHVTVTEIDVPVRTVVEEKIVEKIVRVPIQTYPVKARLAVMPARFARHFEPVVHFGKVVELSGDLNLKLMFTTEYESRMEAPSFTLSLKEAYVSSRKFRVMERSRLPEVLKEIDFGESEYSNQEKVVPKGLAENADYVVLPEIDVIHLVEETKEIPYVGMAQPRLKGKMILRIRVVDTATTQAVVAVTEEVQVERRLRSNEPFQETEINNLVMDLYETASKRALHKTIEAIYPLRIAGVFNGEAVLNRGEGAIDVGDTFEVYKLGSAFIDPDTREILGRSEEKVAVLEVTSLSPKFSKAKITGDIEALKGDSEDYLCRETEESIRNKTELERTPLPF